MMRWNGFAPALVFGAVAAAALLVFEPLVSPLLGVRGALRVFVVGAATLYLLGLGASWRRGFVAAALAGTLGVLLLALPLGLTATATGAAALVAWGRSGILYRSRPARDACVELALGIGGLGLASFLAGGSLVSLALAVWGYFLVQSTFFAIGGIGARRDPAPGDPFERAAAELAALLR
jgi:hypothetical protein